MLKRVRHDAFNLNSYSVNDSEQKEMYDLKHTIMSDWIKAVKKILGIPLTKDIPGLDDKTSLILMLMKLAKADGHIHDFEQSYIFFFSSAIGANQELIGQLKDRLDEVPLVVPENEDDRMQFFFRILTVMKLDMHADEKEMEMCYDLGRDLKFSKQQVKTGIDFMQNNLKKLISFEEFKKVIEAAV